VVAVGTEAAGRQRAGGVMAALLAPTARHLTRQALASASSGTSLVPSACAQCGTTLQPGTKFCAQCGKAAV
jgi:predicted amidophosphoribosyltransferase